MYYFTLKNKFICLFVGAKYFIAFPIISILARYSLKFTRCSLLVVKSLVARCKIYSLLAPEVACRKKSLFTCCKNSLVTRCKIRSVLVAEKSNHIISACVNIGPGVNISCDICFYIAFNNKLHCYLITRFIKRCFKNEFIKGWKNVNLLN